MKHFFLLLIASFFTTFITNAKPVFTKNKYMIATLYDGGTGTISPNSGTYQLIYNADRSEENALETDYWIINNITGNQYSFQNASTGKYIRYDSSTGADRSALRLVDALQSDNSTSFTLELITVNNLSYYVIRSVSNPLKIWNRRSGATGGVYPVGVYERSGTSTNIEQFIFYDSEGNSVVDDGKPAVTLPKATRTLGVFSNYLKTLTFNGKTPAVDTSKKEFYITVPDSLLPGYLSFKVNFTTKDASYQLYVNGAAVKDNGLAEFRYVTGSDIVSIEIRNGSTVLASGNLVFSSLPLVQLFSDVTLGTVYNLGRIAVTEPDKTDTAEILLSDLKIRGAYSAMASIPKKAYAIKLKSEDTSTSLDKSFFGLRSDNNWILDAMYIDPGRVRNRVSTDFWNDFATKPYWFTSEPKMINGTRGQFVEVFLNDSYIGLYCMTEKVDRKQLNLKKLKYSVDSTTVTQRGALYKADNWSTATLMGYPYNGSYTIPAFNNNNILWAAYECKYPDLDDGEPINWKILYDAVIATSSSTNDENFKTEVLARFDLPVYLDYYLFIELILAADNQGKNTYLSAYDQSVSPKLSITPWDLDATWGRRWNGSSNVTYANQNFDTFVINNEHGQSNFFLRMKSLNFDDWNIKLKNRYLELRRTFFNHDLIMSRFQKYMDTFNKSGAAAREKTKWSISDINLELTFLSEWIKSRFTYLDNQYLGAPFTSVQDIALKMRVGSNPVKDILYISNITPGTTIQIFNIQGKMIENVLCNDSETTIQMTSYSPGIYLIKAGENNFRIIRQ
jgi:hypothetical protein